MEEALRALMKADAGIVAAAGGKVEWGAQPQTAVAPYITLHRISGSRELTLTSVAGCDEIRVQAECWGPTYLAAKTAARAVVALLNGYRSATFRRVKIDTEADDHDLDPPTPLYRTRLDLLIRHKA